MKAVYQSDYGAPEVLELRDVEMPSPQAGEVLVQVYAVSLNYADRIALTGQPFIGRLMGGGLFRPRNPILGYDVAGRVAAVGAGVTEFQAGDAVFGDISGTGHGALAEYVIASQDLLVRKPAAITFEQAAAVPLAAVTALIGVRDHAAIRPGERVAVYGASGGVGGYVLQIAKAYGAEVTAVVSPAKLEMARALGADHVIDYTRENFTQNGRRYDVILAVNGYHPLADYVRVLNPAGRYVAIGGTMRQIFEPMLIGPRISRRTGRAISGVDAKADKALLEDVAVLLADGKITPMIDAVYPLDQSVEAFRHLVYGQPAGKVVVTVRSSGDEAGL